MPRLIRVVRFTFDGHSNARYGTVEFVVSDDPRFLRFEPGKLYKGWDESTKRLDIDALLADDVVANPVESATLCEEAGLTSSSESACMVRSVEITDEQATEYRRVIEDYARLRSTKM